METTDGMLREILRSAWWVMLLRGILAMILGLFALLKPEGMIIGIVQVMGFFFLLDGVLLIIGAIMGHAGASRWMALLGGIFYFLAGSAIFSSPLLSALVTEVFVIYLMAFFVLVTGVLRMATALRLWKEGNHKWWLLAEGVIQVVFAMILIEAPVVSAVVLMRIAGAFAIALAIAMIALAIGLRKASASV